METAQTVTQIGCLICQEDETGIPIYRKTVILEIEGSIGPALIFPVDKNIRKIGADSKKGQKTKSGL